MFDSPISDIYNNVNYLTTYLNGFVIRTPLPEEGTEKKSVRCLNFEFFEMDDLLFSCVHLDEV